MLSVDPVTNPPSSEHRNATPRAISLAWPKPPDRNFRHDLLQHVGRNRRDHVGVDIPRRNRVDRHAGLRAFLRQCLGEAVNARFRGGIIDLAILPRLPVDRPDIDDPPPFARPHAGEHGFGHVEAPAEIGVDHLFPVLIAHLQDGAVARDAGIVDDDIDIAEVARDLRAAGLACVVIAHIPFIGGDSGAIGERLRARLASPP